MYEYGICNEVNESIYEEQCKIIETKLKGVEKLKLLIDVDGSKIQNYIYKSKKITVVNSLYLSEVVVRTEIKLDNIFGAYNCIDI